MKKQELIPSASYLRYSSHNQNEQSIEGQRRVIESYCKLHGLVIVEEYIDRAIPGKTDNRPEFQRMVADTASGKFQALVIYKTDRFARNKRDSVLYKSHIRELGVQIHYAAETIPLGPEGVLMESIMEGLAEYYSVDLSQKIQRGMHESALKHQYTGGGRTFGYKYMPDKTFAIEPKEAEIVKQIFSMYINGVPNTKICAHVNQLGFHTTRNLPFSKNSIPRMIKNESYIGTYSNGSVVAANAVPAIVSKEVFYVAQQELEKRRTSKQIRTPRADYALSGKLYCGHCKKKMVGVSGTGKSGNKFYYYYCPTSKARKGCELKPATRDYVENEVVSQTLRFLLTPEAIKHISEKTVEVQRRANAASNEIGQLEQKLIDNKGAIANIVAAIECGVQTATLPARLRALETERAQLEVRLRLAEETNPVLDETEIEFLLMNYTQSNPDHKNAIIKGFVSQVFMYNDRFSFFYSLDGKRVEVSRETLESLESQGSEVFDQRCVCSTTVTSGRTPTELVILAYGIVLTVPREVRQV